MWDARTLSKPARSGRWMAAKFSHDIIFGMWQEAQLLRLCVPPCEKKYAAVVWQSVHSFFRFGTV